MVKLRVLVSWIGHSDLRAMAKSLPDSKGEAILSKIGDGPDVEGDVGPVKSLLDKESFESIRLLSNYSAAWTKQFADWVGCGAQAKRVNLKSPTDYVSIYEAASAELSEITADPSLSEAELCMHLSPGTPAMTAVWLLRLRLSNLLRYGKPAEP